MKRIFLELLVSATILISVVSLASAASQINTSMVPLPPSIQNLPTIDIKPWVQIDQKEAFLEGPAFDRAGNLFVSSSFEGRIIKITPDKKISTFFQKPIAPNGIAIHKDGRLFVACIRGILAVIDPDGTNYTEIQTKLDGFPRSMNDLVFDLQGNLYITDFIGTSTGPVGGVYRYSSDYKTVKRIFGNLAAANGIGLNHKKNMLYFTESGRNTLHLIKLKKDGITMKPILGSEIPYRFSGGPGGSDSMALDEDGRIYQALIFQGRILVLSTNGIPIAQVLMPGRDEGKLLKTTNIAFKPGTDQAYVTVSGKGGAWIYTFKGLAKGMPLYSHQ